MDSSTSKHFLWTIFGVRSCGQLTAGFANCGLGPPTFLAIEYPGEHNLFLCNNLILKLKMIMYCCQDACWIFTSLLSLTSSICLFSLSYLLLYNCFSIWSHCCPCKLVFTLTFNYFAWPLHLCIICISCVLGRKRHVRGNRQKKWAVRNTSSPLRPSPG